MLTDGGGQGVRVPHGRQDLVAEAGEDAGQRDGEEDRGADEHHERHDARDEQDEEGRDGHGAACDARREVRE
ncbi:hypothetical protein GCM10010250_03680 [Streptomyces althioticus]|nr:hypothetical protein GCM10010250_03680 [Streptomyces althioticus]